VLRVHCGTTYGALARKLSLSRPKSKLCRSFFCTWHCSVALQCVRVHCADVLHLKCRMPATVVHINYNIHHKITGKKIPFGSEPPNRKLKGKLQACLSSSCARPRNRDNTIHITGTWLCRLSAITELTEAHRARSRRVTVGPQDWNVRVNAWDASAIENWLRRPWLPSTSSSVE
jgi:hypothetical protein